MYAVLFDIDGTLLNTGGAGSHAFAQTFRDVFQLEEFPPGISFAGRSDRAIANEIMQKSDIAPTAENWQRFFDGYCQRIDASLQHCEGSVLPGVLTLLNALEADEHVVTGLLTGNTDFGAQRKTAAYGLADRFAFGGYGDLRTDRNEIASDARIAAIKHIEEQNLGDGNLCGTMVIGDTPADIHCGQAIDAYVVAVATGGCAAEELAKHQPDLVLEDLTDTGALLAEISAAQQRCLQLAS